MHSKPSHCFDCNGQTFLYSLHDDVWLQAWPDYESAKADAEARNGPFVNTLHGGKQRNPLCCLCLCIPCLEKRLDRPLTIDDFDNSPANDPIRFGLHLKTGDPLRHQPSPETKNYTLTVKEGDTLFGKHSGTIYEVLVVDKSSVALCAIDIVKGVLAVDTINGCLSTKDYSPYPKAKDEP